VASISRPFVSLAPTGGCGERRATRGRSTRSNQAGQRPRRRVAASASATARDAAVAQGAHSWRRDRARGHIGRGVWALQNNRHRNAAPEELYSTDHRTTADGLAGLPRDYAGIPRQAPPIGPPLPGDLGRPMLNASAASNAVIPAGPAVDPEAQRRAQEIEAARLSRLFASTIVRELPSVAPTPSSRVTSDIGAASGPTAQPSTDSGFAQNGQDRKLGFVNASADRRTTSVDRLESPVSPYVVQAGTVISGALITGIRSDLPGPNHRPGLGERL